MTIFLDAQETVDRFQVYIQELRAILVANNLKFGSPDNFFAFVRRLQSDDLLPVDLTRMVKFIIERERGKVSLRTILTIIAIAGGGSAVSETNRDLTKPVNVVIDFLIRSGNFGRADLEHLDNPCTSPFTATTKIEKGVSAKEASSDQIDTSTHPLSPLDGSTELIRSLDRLELNALQAKQYLDSIEQRISAIEPLLKDVPSLVSPPPQQSPARDTEPLYRAVPLVEPPSGPSDLPLPSFVHRVSTQAKEYVARFSLLGKKLSLLGDQFSLLGKQYLLLAEQLAAVPVLATIAGGILLYVSYPRNTPKTEISPSIPAPVATITPMAIEGVSDATPLTVTATASATDHEPKKSSASILKTNAFDTKPIKNSSHRNPRPTNPPADYAGTRLASPANATDAETLSMQDSTQATLDVSYPLAHIPARSASSPRIVNVSSGIMAANLVSASPPSYPKLAGLTHMQGEVVMQAIISKDGTVENLHVIQGHRLLRGAAKNSARTWRYRPYLVNGKPVEVATIVSVDFTLPH